MQVKKRKRKKENTFQKEDLPRIYRQKLFFLMKRSVPLPLSKNHRTKRVEQVCIKLVQFSARISAILPPLPYSLSVPTLAQHREEHTEGASRLSSDIVIFHQHTCGMEGPGRLGSLCSTTGIITKGRN